MKYVKRYWSESRGDSQDDWGRSWWYFELREDGCVSRQIEEYENGRFSRYDEKNKEDEFGFLSTEAIIDPESGYTRIEKNEFERKWNERK